VRWVDEGEGLTVVCTNATYLHGWLSVLQAQRSQLTQAEIPLLDLADLFPVVLRPRNQVQSSGTVDSRERS
jgi:hypothetical protein